MDILFFSEAVTLAHIARPIVLALAAQAAGHRVVLARSNRFDWLTKQYSLDCIDLESISPESFAAALAHGSPLYSSSTLEDYVRQDLDLIEHHKPDRIVGDFRLSLSVSARLAGVPYLAIANAYWSPYAHQDYVVPSLPMTRWLPIPVANALFLAARPLAFRIHAIPLNRVRRKHGLPSLGLDLRRVYTDADRVLYADIPDMFPLQDSPGNHVFIGPILWSPPGALPEWWDSLPTERPIVYATPGSSGQHGLLPMIVEALADLPVTVIAASAGGDVSIRNAANVFLANYLPGTAAAARADLVICNGGSPTCQQALAAGVPVLGLPGNLDQFLNMAALVRSGVGAMLRADRTSPSRLRRSAAALLVDADVRKRAQRFAALCSQLDAKDAFLTQLC
jgi:UDP:flavonoid glycosyltransferase YjiC (YdhE family)